MFDMVFEAIDGKQISSLVLLRISETCIRDHYLVRTLQSLVLTF